MNKYYPLFLAIISICLLTSCTKESLPVQAHIEKLITNNEMKCPTIMHEITLKDEQDHLVVCDLTDKIQVIQLSNIKGEWKKHKHASISKQPNELINWIVKRFEAEHPYFVAMGVLLDENVVTFEVTDLTQSYSATIVDTNQHYRFWYYIFDQSIYKEIPNVKSFAGYDKQSNKIVSFP